MYRKLGRTLAGSRKAPRRVLVGSLAVFAISQLKCGWTAAAWSVAAPLGKQSTAKEVVDKYAPDKLLTGRVAVVTGGNSGIGLETVKALASAGCRVVLASRSVEAGMRAIEEIKSPGVGGYEVVDADIDVMELDLADLGSVVTFAENLLASQQRLDYVVLNAGVMALPSLERTSDGFEMQIGVNHFGHALLARLLRPTIEAQSHPSRIVTLSSTAHNMAQEFRIDNLNFEGNAASKYSPWGAYGNSKLANALFAKALARRLPADGRVTSLSVHPGVIRTKLWRSTPASNWLGGWLLERLVADKTIPQGAATTLWACLAGKAATKDYAGAYLADCAEAALSSNGRDDKLAEALWEETDRQLDKALAQRGLGPDGKPLAQAKSVAKEFQDA